MSNDRMAVDIARHLIEQIEPTMKRTMEVAAVALDEGQLADVARAAATAITCQLVGMVVGFAKEGAEDTVYELMSVAIAQHVADQRPRVVAGIAAEKARRSGGGQHDLRASS